MGLVNIVQHGKQRFFLPQDGPSAINCLERLIEQYPPDSSEIEFLPEMEVNHEIFTKEEPVKIPEWLIEPESELVGELVFQQEDLYDQKSAHGVDNVLTV